MTEIQCITVAGKDAIKTLERLRREYESTGLYPILFGTTEEFEQIEENREDPFDVDMILKQSYEIDPAGWFREHPEEEFPEISPPEQGEWPEERIQEMGLITHRDVRNGKPFPEVIIGLLRLATPWEVFAHLNWGHWNDCPSPQEHCAVHRYWALRYGAEVATIIGDVVQCTVASPPSDRAGSLELARQQYAYCYDIVEQGTETIAALAASLLNAKTWYFWWD